MAPINISDSAYDSIAVVGPTACGKTRCAVTLAHAFNGEILSADSRQVYRGMSIGTGKDLRDYDNIPYHLIDIVDAGAKFNLHQFLQAFHASYQDIIRRGKTPVICGGSGMYVENALRGIKLPDVPENLDLRLQLQDKSLDELTKILSRYKQLHNKTDVDTVKRALRAIEICDYYEQNPEVKAEAEYQSAKPLKTLVLGLEINRDKRRELITKRLLDRLEEGLINEVKDLLDSGLQAEDLIYYGLEYKFVTLHLIGKLTYNEMFKQLETAIHQFAKRQMTWFRGMEKRGVPIIWLPYDIEKENLIEFVSDRMGCNISGKNLGDRR